VVTLAEIPLDIIVTNIIECLSGLNMTEKINEFKNTFKKRKRTWALDDLSNYSSVTKKNITTMQKLGFSYQYYAILSMNCFCVISSMIGLDLISMYNYNPLRDQFMIILIGLIGMYFYGLRKLLRKIFEIIDEIYYKENLSTKAEEDLLMQRRLKPNKKKKLESNIPNQIEFYKEYLLENDIKYKNQSKDLMIQLNEKSNFLI